MTPQNLAVCFGPVLLPARQAPSRPRIHGSGPGLASADVDFKRHIEVLHYLLQAWPGERPIPPSRQLAPGRPMGASGFREAPPPQTERAWSPGCPGNRLHFNRPDAASGPANRKPVALATIFRLGQ